ncbi:hypothetical protein FACS189450_03090 [Spirochaetia bacterium]|nr:hypothetical protein FACS189450_03090 [Spirochaetia bacterium]
MGYIFHEALRPLAGKPFGAYTAFRVLMNTNPIETLLLEKSKNPNALFVFPTGIAVDLWADRLLKLQDGGTIAMEQFIAWDTFKQESIRSRMQDKKSVPSLLRKIFVSRLIQENAGLCKAGQTPLFISLIPPAYAHTASSFVPWLTGVLSQLGSWFEKSTGRPVSSITTADTAGAIVAAGNNFDKDDQDLCTMALQYQRFLDSHGLFEPAWEKPPFDDNGKECFIFFSESLTDFAEYEALLENAEHVTIVRLADTGAEAKPHKTFFYTNARSEITEAALYIRALVENEQLSWDAIAVSVPDTENYEPYLLREFANRNIPAVHREGKPLASWPAGQFFPALSNCFSQGFSFDAVANLLLNSHLPWKDRAVIDQLIDFGIKNNCICSWKEVDGLESDNKNIDVWEDAFSAPAGGREERAHALYRTLKKDIGNICRADSFEEIRRQYFVFRGHFLDMDECLPESDMILSRCVSELLLLIEIEKSFPDARAPDPYTFFVEHLQEKTYLPQESTSGVSILPYRTAAPAPFACHIVLGAAQDNLTAVFSRLAFLPRSKRDKLDIRDQDASEAFINLHKLNSEKPAAFFCSQQSFSGYAIPHSRLNVTEKPRLRYGETDTASFAHDAYQEEHNFFQGLQSTNPAAERTGYGCLGKVFDSGYIPFISPQRGGVCTLRIQSGNAGAAFPQNLHSLQKESFVAWLKRRQHISDNSANEGPAENMLMELIQKRYQNPELSGKIGVSASGMEPYYQCAMQWLFRNILKLEDVRMETTLMAENILGSLYHAVLEHFFNTLMGEGKDILLLPDNETLPSAYGDYLTNSITETFTGLPVLSGEQYDLSALTLRLLREQQGAVQEQIEIFLIAFLRYFANYRIVGTEKKYIWDAPDKDYYLTGIIDCILENVTGDDQEPERVIVDFKLGNPPDRKSCIGNGETGLENFQLPMYLCLVEKNGSKPIEGALFFSIFHVKPTVIFGMIQDAINGKKIPYREKDRITRTSSNDTKDNMPVFGLIMNEFNEKAARYAQEIQSCEFTTISTGDKKCASCVYHTVCRTIYTVDRERNLQRQGSFL